MKWLFACWLLLPGFLVAQNLDLSVDPYPATPVPDRIILTWQGNPARSQAVTWRTDTSITEALAEIALAQPDPDFVTEARQVKAHTEGLLTDRGKVHMHSVNFTRLKPDHQYVYRVGDSLNWSEWIQFRTASKTTRPFSFLYFGDAQNALKSHWSRVIRQALLEAPKARFMIHAGDLVNRSEYDAEWGDWFYAGGWMNSMIPSLPTPGNHEYERDKYGNRSLLSAHWRPSFNLPIHGPKGLEETVYKIDFQGLRIISLNTQAMMLDENQALRQAQWLDSVLSTDPQPWTVVTHHHPVFASRPGRDNWLLQQHLKPVYDTHGVDLVLQGHDHTYARGGNLPFGQPVRLNSGPLYVVSVSGPKMYETNFADWMERVGMNTQLYQVISVSEDSLKYAAYTVLGELYDAFSIMRNSDGSKVFYEEAVGELPYRLDMPPQVKREYGARRLRQYETRFRRFKARMKAVQAEGGG